MTLAVASSPSSPSTPPASSTKDAHARPPRRRSRRWLRLAIPFAVVLLFWAITFVVHLIEEPRLSDAGTLSPTGTGRHGSSQLADRLRDKGITIQRVTTSDAAALAARNNDATLFVPTPDYLLPGFLEGWLEAPGHHRIVLVRPGLLTTFTLGPPIGIRDSRWATRVAAPDCGTDYARQAGPAGVQHDTYQADHPQTLCYGGSLIALAEGDVEVVYIGATDPFRNDRIDEHGNAALATGLLGEFDRLIWVDVHAPEPRDTPDFNFKLPDYNRNDQNRTNTGSELIDAFPAALWAVLLVVGAGAMLLAIARARRLGPPVPEPLPVLVPAAEAVTGRGRLYQRIAARQASLDALRAAAIARLARVLDPMAGIARERQLTHAGPAADRFINLVAERSGWSAPDVYDVLYGDSPDSDEALVDAVAQLDLLVLHAISPTQGGAP
jgi:hypothetical protein